MMAVMSPSALSSATSPPAAPSTAAAAPPATPAASHSDLHHPVASPPPSSRHGTLSRPLSHASRKRLSQYSTASSGGGGGVAGGGGGGGAGSLNGLASACSRPGSHMFSTHALSLPYTLVRDFAYPVVHPLHYGPPPEPTPPLSASESQRRLSDPPAQSWDDRMSWESWGCIGGTGAGRSSSVGHIEGGPAEWDTQERHVTLADGPPWSEDEDLQSPVVSSRHKKNSKTAAAGPGPGASEDDVVLDPKNYDRTRGGYYVGTNRDGGKRYYLDDGAEANGPGGEYVTYPADTADAADAADATGDRYRVGQPRQLADNDDGRQGRRATHGRAGRGHHGHDKDDCRSDSEDSSPASSSGRHDDQSRYSRDYQFTITSPDEEMHGKAVALFDFERENENELPLVEGQIIWVSYRHGQGWLVAKDPKTQENGLVPEAYVRLLRDIEGGMTSLAAVDDAGGESPALASPRDQETAAAVAASTTPVDADADAVAVAPADADTADSAPAAAAIRIQTQTQTQTERAPSPGQTPPITISSSSHAHAHAHSHSTASANGYHQPIVSTFSTSSKDLDPYPTNQLGIQAGQAPPQVVHYHGQRGGSSSQTNTPVSAVHQDTGFLPRGSLDSGGRKRSDPSISATEGKKKSEQQR